MDNDYEDLLYTNRWIRDDNLEDVPSEEKAKFRKYYKEKKEKKARKQLAKELEEQLSIEFEPDDLMNTNKLNNSNQIDTTTQLMMQNIPQQFLPFSMGGLPQVNNNNNQQITPTGSIPNFGGVTGQQTISSSAAQEQVGGNKQRNRVSIINIDSRNRDTLIYPLPNDFIISLDREYTSIQRLRLLSIEFPNTDFTLNNPRTKFRLIAPRTYEFQTLTGDSTLGFLNINIIAGNYSVDSLLEEIENQATLQGLCLKGIYNENTNIVEFFFFSWDGNLIDSFTPNDSSNSLSNTIYIQLTGSFNIGPNNLAVTVVTTINSDPSNAIIGDSSTVFIENLTGTYSGVSGNTLNGYYKVVSILFNLTSGVDNLLDIDETPSGGGPLTVSIVPNGGFAGTFDIFSMADMALSIETSLNAASVLITYDVYVDSRNRFVISGSSAFDILWATGPNGAPNAFGLIIQTVDTFVDQVGASTYFMNTYRPLNYVLAFQDLTKKNLCGIDFKIENPIANTPINGEARFYATTNFALDFESTDTFGDLLGFPQEFSSTLMNNPRILVPTTITQTIPPYTTPTIITIPDHGLISGDKITFNFPSLKEITTSLQNTDEVTVTVTNSNTITISEFINASTVVSPIIKIFPVTSGNFTTKTISITDINNIIANGGIGFAVPSFPTSTINLSVASHGLSLGDSIKLFNLSTQPPLTFFITTEVFTITAIPDANTITITTSSTVEFITESSIANSFISSNIITANHRDHNLVTDDKVKFYDVVNFADLSFENFSNKLKTITVIDSDTYTFTIDNFPTSTVTNGGGTVIRVHSEISRTDAPFHYGMSQSQSNTVGNKGIELFKAPSMDGESYAFLTSKTLQLAPTETVKETTNIVKNIFAKIQLNEPPNNIIFNSFVTNDIIFIDRVLPILREIQFTIRRPDNTLYDLNRRNFSVTLEITEVTNRLSNATFNSRSGKIDDVFTI